MKKYLFISALVLSIFSIQFAYADISLSDQKSIPVCTYMRGVENFPKLTFLVEEKTPGGITTVKAVGENDCIAASYKFNTVKLFAVNTDHYIQSSQISGYQPSKDQYAYPAEKDIETTPKLILSTDATEYEHYNYEINGIDNNARLLKISFQFMETNLMVADGFPPQISGLDSEILLPLTKDSSGPFNDITEDSPYREAVTYLKDKGIVSGYADGTFRPSATINRAEFTTILMKAGYDAGTVEKHSKPTVYDQVQAPFTDVPLDTSVWYADDVNWAATLSLIQGYPDGTFRPSQQINFAESAKILKNVFKLSRPSGTSVLINHPWYYDPIVTLQIQKAIPTTIKLFDQKITRGEMAEMVYRIMSKNTSLPSQGYDNLK